MKAWQCIGCGRIEAPQTCVGVCEYGRIEVMHTWEHEQALEEERRRWARYEKLVHRLARVTPRAGEWERTYRALQDEARRLAGVRSDTTPSRRSRPP